MVCFFLMVKKLWHHDFESNDCFGPLRDGECDGVEADDCLDVLLPLRRFDGRIFIVNFCSTQSTNTVIFKVVFAP